MFEMNDPFNYVEGDTAALSYLPEAWLRNLPPRARIHARWEQTIERGHRVIREAGYSKNARGQFVRDAGVGVFGEDDSEAVYADEIVSANGFAEMTFRIISLPEGVA